MLQYRECCFRAGHNILYILLYNMIYPSINNKTVVNENLQNKVKVNVLRHILIGPQHCHPWVLNQHRGDSL